jgi:uncharacterized protein
MSNEAVTTFCRFELRTTDAVAARSFYTSIFGHDRATIWPLHEQALARGARPHWLGSLSAQDVERTTAAFVERGAVRLGPTMARGDGSQAAIVRDPGGAVVAISTPPLAGEKEGVIVGFYVLHTQDVARATSNYCQLFGWGLAERLELGEHGVLQQFAWQAGGAPVGAMADVAARPGVHPHWLFFFDVDVLETAMATTRAAGGVVLESAVLPSGDRFCVCDDPQGVAFALRERRPSK